MHPWKTTVRSICKDSGSCTVASALQWALVSFEHQTETLLSTRRLGASDEWSDLGLLSNPEHGGFPSNRMVSSAGLLKFASYTST